MIFRQDLEMHRSDYGTKKRDAFAQLQNLEGQYAAQRAEGKTEEELQPLWDEIRDTRDSCAAYAGAYQAIDYLIQEVDLEEPELEIINPFEEVKAPLVQT